MPKLEEVMNPEILNGEQAVAFSGCCLSSVTWILVPLSNGMMTVFS